MFKVGDKVVCIDDENYYELILYKTYTIKIKMLNSVVLEEFNDLIYNNRFILLTEYRKQKIKKICLRLEIR